MRTWGITLLVLILIVIVGGCSSTSPESTMALAPSADSPAAGARGTSALSWGAPVVVDDHYWTGQRVGTSLAIIDGNPAVSYVLWRIQGRSASYTVYYARANDSGGTSWGRPIAAASWWAPMSTPPDYVMHFTSLCEVNGRPAIAYMDGGAPKARDLKFVRANDSIGRKWGTPVIADGNGDTGLAATMKVVNGNPAIVYKDYQTTSYYVRALDANGDTWGTPVQLSAYQIVVETLEIVNGNPAVCYALGGQLIYNRATDANGEDWGTPQVVLGRAGDSRYTRNSLVVVDGHPAIAYGGDFRTYGVYFIRALDIDGGAWPLEAVTVMDASSLAWHGDMANIGGLPSIAFLQTDIDANPSPVTLNFIQALDASGSTWGTPGSLTSLGTLRHQSPHPKLAAVGSGAGIAFLDELHAMNFVGALPLPDPAVNVQLSTDKSIYIIGQDTSAELTAVVTDEYGDPISGLDAGAFVTTLDGSPATVTFNEGGTAGTYTGNLDISGLLVGDHTVQTIATDTRDTSGSDSASFTVSEPGSGGTMHVGDLDATSDPGPHGWWRASFTLKIDDSSHNPVSAADVAFILSGEDSGSGQITTGADGTASYQTGWIKTSGSVTFTVDDVTHATLTYGSGDNHDPDGDSDGTSITISGP